VAGLQTVDAHVLVEQWIPVALLDVVIGELLFGVEMIIFRKILDQVLRERREIPHRRQMFRIGPAGCIPDGRVGHAEFFRPAGRGTGKGLLRPVETFGDDDAGIVARLDDDPADEIFDLHPAVHLDEHLRPTHPPSLFADGEGVLHRQTPLLDAVEEHVGRHQLAHRRRWRELVRRLFEQDRVRLQVDQNGVLGNRLHRHLAVGEGCMDDDQKGGNGAAKETNHGSFPADGSQPAHPEWDAGPTRPQSAPTSSRSAAMTKA